MTNLKETMWQRTLQSFSRDRCLVRLRGDRERIGRWFSLEANAGTLRLDDGATVLISYGDILSVETAK